MSVTLDTSHSAIGPCGLSGQSPSGDNFRHASTALLSSLPVCGENAGGAGGGAVGLSSKNLGWPERKYASVRVKIWSKVGFGFGGDWGCAFVHAPQQKFGNALIRSMRNRIPSREGKQICALGILILLVPLCPRVCLHTIQAVYLRIYAQACYNIHCAGTL